MGGACGTCRAKLVDGTVEMDQNFALGPADLDAGYVLTCQSHPTSADASPSTTTPEKRQPMAFQRRDRF